MLGRQKHCRECPANTSAGLSSVMRSWALGKRTGTAYPRNWQARLSVHASSLTPFLHALCTPIASSTGRPLLAPLTPSNCMLSGGAFVPFNPQVFGTPCVQGEAQEPKQGAKGGDTEETVVAGWTPSFLPPLAMKKQVRWLGHLMCAASRSLV